MPLLRDGGFRGGRGAGRACARARGGQMRLEWALLGLEVFRALLYGKGETRMKTKEGGGEGAR